jgi:hypothetical protein
MIDGPTDDQIALLCDIGEGASELSKDKKRDLQRLLSEGYVELAPDHSNSTVQLTAKGRKFLGERGAGLNEA